MRPARFERKGEAQVAGMFAFSSPILESVAARICVVSFTDSEGVTRSVEVAASSLFEAAVRGMAAFGRPELTDGVAVGSAVRLTVAVKNPAVKHTVSVDRIRAWLTAAGRDPREQALKARLRDEIGSF